jgi:hypothetical protein
MQFGEFVFKENPVKINVKYGRNLNRINVTGVGEIILNRGKAARTVEGEGVIVGYDALQRFNKLAVLFETSEEAKILVLPNGKAFWSHFSKLAMNGEGNVGKVRYSFEFVEDCTNGGLND